MARISPQGYAPTRIPAEDDGRRRSRRITAIQTRTPAPIRTCRGAVPAVRSTAPARSPRSSCASRQRTRPSRTSTSGRQCQIASADRRCEPAATRCSAPSSRTRRTTRRVDRARSPWPSTATQETAWTHRHRSRAPQRAAHSHIHAGGAAGLSRRARQLGLQLVAAARRLEQRRQPEQQPRPLPSLRDGRGRRCPGRPCRPRAGDRSTASRIAHRSGQARAVQRTGATTVPELARGQRAHRSALDRATRTARRSLCYSEREIAAHHAPARTRRFPEARRKRSPPACPAFLNAADVKTRRRRASDFARWLVSPRRAHDGAGVREPRLAALLRHGHRRHERRPRHAGRTAQPSGTARLARRRVHGLAAGT